MKNFKIIREQNEILGRLSNKHKHLKELLINDLDPQSVDDLKNTLEMNREALENKGKTTFPSFQTLEDKVKFWQDHNDLIDSVLEDTDWFTQTPAQNNIHTTVTWITTALDRAVLEVVKTILNEIQ